VITSLAASALASPRTASAAAPANDDIANATPISTVPYSTTVDNTEATLEPGEPQSCYPPIDNTVWFKFIPAVTGGASIDTLGSFGSIGLTGNYTGGALYRADGSGFAGLTLVGCITGSTNYATTPLVQANTTYYIQIGGIFGQTGVINLHITAIPPPAFDDRNSATVIPNVSYQNEANSLFATSAVSDPSCFGTGATVWYRFTPTQDMNLEAKVQPQFGNDPSKFTLSVYAGDSLKQLACSDNSSNVGGFPSPHVEFRAKANIPLYFMVGTSGGTPGGDFFFSLQRPLQITTSVDRTFPVTTDGLVTVSGTLKCERPLVESLFVYLQQTLAGKPTAVAVGGPAAFICGPQGSPWTFTTTSVFPDTYFATGPATVSVTPQFQCDSQGCQPGALLGQRLRRNHHAIRSAGSAGRQLTLHRSQGRKERHDRRRSFESLAAIRRPMSLSDHSARSRSSSISSVSAVAAIGLATAVRSSRPASSN
jgi:hypothetical protein